MCAIFLSPFIVIFKAYCPARRRGNLRQISKARDSAIQKGNKGIPKSTKSWESLRDHAKTFKKDGFRLSSLFEQNEGRFQKFSLQQEDLLLDFSKNYLTDETLNLLVELANECQLPESIEAMFNGEEINSTEQRPALHTALREPEDISKRPEVAETLKRMESIVDQVRSGSWTGFGGEQISDVVNIGIGGSDLGPAMISEALSTFETGNIKIHYLSNLDPAHAESCLRELKPESTLFIIASKSFTTLETRQNTEFAKHWFLTKGGDESLISRHFIASTSNVEAALEMGIVEENIFPLWDWVGGRFSLWSAIGLPIAMGIGMQNFRQLLAGAHAMDQHFRHAPFEENIPVLMALLSIWYTGFFEAKSCALVPYSQKFKLLPNYLQQLYMESLGKSVDLQGNSVSTNTGEVIWGSVGSNGQHSFFQLLHQGTEFIPVDFIALANCDTDAAEQHQHLLANCFSQSIALMEGSDDDSDSHKIIRGNKPSNTLLLRELNPYILGNLIALYEHKVFTQSVIWNINAFDQWGVELGKKLSTSVFNAFEDTKEASTLDDSTLNLIKKVKESQP